MHTARGSEPPRTQPPVSVPHPLLQQLATVIKMVINAMGRAMAWLLVIPHHLQLWCRGALWYHRRTATGLTNLDSRVEMQLLLGAVKMENDVLPTFKMMKAIKGHADAVK